MLEMESNETIVPNIRYDIMLRWHLLFSYFILFVCPIIEMIVCLPSELDFPRSEYLWAFMLAGIHFVLVLFSFADIYQLEAYYEKDARSISFTARMLKGIAMSELIMILTHCLYLYKCWPLFYKTMYHIYRIYGLDVTITNKFNSDCFAMMLAQLFRLFNVQAKITIALRIRWATHVRNCAIFKNEPRLCRTYQMIN